MKSRFFYFAPIVAAAVALSGCEWGGAHEDTWNDGYSWANFTGTYRFVNAFIIPASEEEDTDSTTPGDIEHTDGTGNGKMVTSSSASGQVSPVGKGIKPGKFSMTVGSYTITDDENGGLLCNGKKVGSVSYSSGKWSITDYFGASGGTHIAITYTYLTNGPVVPPPGPTTVDISYLNVVQQGNRIKLSSDNGIVYNGRITGANVGRDDYQAARTIYISFEASAPTGGKITGTMSGAWSGATEKTYGTLSSRKLNGTHSRAGNFVAVAADKTILIPPVITSETGPSVYETPTE